MRKTTQSELVKRAKAGDQDAFGELVRRNAERVGRLIARVVRRKVEAEDVVQMVFLEAYRSLPGFDGRARFSTWLHRIAVRVGVRAAKGAPMAAVATEESHVVETPTAAPPPVDPERAADVHEGVARLDQLVSQLPSTQQSAFVLHAMEDRSMKSIAKVLRTSTSAVKVRVFKARQTLNRHARSDTWFRLARGRHATPVP